MKMPDHRFRKVIIVLAVNIFISWVIGNIYKDVLIKTLSAQVYYQAVVLISLMIAPSISAIYSKYINFKLKSREKKISRRINDNILDKLNGDDKEYAESLINPAVEVHQQIKLLRAERDAFEKSS
ncbi:hypothetical protein D3C80_44340 [compost metagenome]